MSLDTLPQELQIEIFSQSPEVSVIGGQISKTLQTAANDVCLKTIGLKPISKTEFKNYLETEPKIVGRMFGTVSNLIDDNEILFADINMLQNFGDTTPEWASTSLNPLGDNDANYLTQIDISYSHETNSWEDTELSTIDDLCRANVDTYDLLTIYRIFKRREGCMRLDPAYAKTRTLAIFDEICSKRDGLDLIYLHLYLSMHQWIFNLDVKSNNYSLTYNHKTKSFDEEDAESIAKILNDVEILIDKIRKYLAILD